MEDINDTLEIERNVGVTGQPWTEDEINFSSGVRADEARKAIALEAIRKPLSNFREKKLLVKGT